MGTLTSYKSIEEKQAVFTNCVFCDTEKDIRDWLTGIGEGSLNGVGMAFRGLTRGSYKLYSSLQRSWVEQDLALHQQNHKGIVQRILDEAFEQRVNGTSLVNGERDELAMLSYLQHHGCPTPFLDFTSDVRVALFFASQEPKGAGNGSELDNYFSISSIAKLWMP